MRHRNFRIEDDTWSDALLAAELCDERMSDVLRDFVRAYVRKRRKLIDAERARRELS